MESSKLFDHNKMLERLGLEEIHPVYDGDTHIVPVYKDKTKVDPKLAHYIKLIDVISEVMDEMPSTFVPVSYYTRFQFIMFNEIEQMFFKFNNVYGCKPQADSDPDNDIPFKGDLMDIVKALEDPELQTKIEETLLELADKVTLLSYTARPSAAIKMANKLYIYLITILRIRAYLDYTGFLGEKAPIEDIFDDIDKPFPGHEEFVANLLKEKNN
nr:MAG TPA: hypothetical protein [Caudoviricetes sp.]